MKKQAFTIKGEKLFPKLRLFSNFYLAGGTALALQLGHRVSVDFDLFSNEEIPSNFIEKVKKVFNGYVVKPLINTKDELTVLVDGVKITFLYYPFPVLMNFQNMEGLNVMDKKEIGATKAYVLGRRAVLKDYIDLYFLLNDSYITLEKLINMTEKKYGGEFNTRLFLEQLVALEDMDDEVEINFLQKKIDRTKLIDFFKKLVSDFKL